MHPNENINNTGEIKRILQVLRIWNVTFHLRDRMRLRLLTRVVAHCNSAFSLIYRNSNYEQSTNSVGSKTVRSVITPEISIFYVPEKK
jgi:hypothetical protein